MARGVRRGVRELARGAAPLLAPLVALLLRALAATWRVSVEGLGRSPDAPRGPLLAGVWHRGILAGACAMRGSGLYAPVSRSADGDLIAATIVHLGLGPPPRGSSRRGGTAALRALVRLLRDGHFVVIPTDGPLGPPRVSKPGIAQLARLAGVPVHPVAVAASPSLRFPSWDGLLLPLPFARLVCRFGEPLAVAPDADRPALEAVCAELDRRVGELTEQVEAALRGN